MGSLSIVHWLAVLLIVLLIFGSRKLRDVGADLGGALRGFKQASAGEQERSGHGARRADAD